MKILVLGISGMLGNAMFRVLSMTGDGDVYGSARSASVRRFFDPKLHDAIITNVDVENHDSLVRVFAEVKPQVVVNCVGLIKQRADSRDPLQVLPINAMFPHRLAKLCNLCDTRLIHISTDCVFSGQKGNYREAEEPDATDLYGKSKHFGEVYYPHTVTLRTSIIGHELAGSNGLISWFLSQEGCVNGYTKAVFSGLPTVELSRIVRDIVLPQPDLSGLYHVASDPIAKFDLLRLVADKYGKSIEIVPDESVVINRSLNAEYFCQKTGYVAPSWPALITSMRDFN